MNRCTDLLCAREIRSVAAARQTRLQNARIVAYSKLAHTVLRHALALPVVDHPPQIDISLQHAKAPKAIEIGSECDMILSQPFGQLGHSIGVRFNSLADVRGKGPQTYNPAVARNFFCRFERELAAAPDQRRSVALLHD